MIRIAIVEDDADQRRMIRKNALNGARKENVEIDFVEFEDGLAFIGGYEKLEVRNNGTDLPKLRQVLPCQRASLRQRSGIFWRRRARGGQYPRS